MLVWIRCSPFLMEILFIFVTPCFPRANAISSSVAKTSSKDSITINLGKSAASFSKSNSERFRLDFLFEDAIYAAYFSLALRSTTHHGVQLVFGINQGGNLFALVEMGIRDQYTRGEGRLPNRCQFQFLSTGQIPIINAIDLQPPPCST